MTRDLTIPIFGTHGTEDLDTSRWHHMTTSDKDWTLASKLCYMIIQLYQKRLELQTEIHPTVDVEISSTYYRFLQYLLSSISSNVKSGYSANVHYESIQLEAKVAPTCHTDGMNR